MLNDDHLLMTWTGTAVLEDGTEHPVELDITVGAVRDYMTDPARCQCDDCRQIFPQAMRVLTLQEDVLAGKITEKQIKRELRRMGYRREEKIQHH
jgi:hypothetical protein